MKPDGFEKRLERQALRSIPAEWRAEMLDAAKRAAHPRDLKGFSASSGCPESPGWLERLRPWRGQMAALGFAWSLILIMNATLPTFPRPTIWKSPATLPEMTIAQQEQQRLLAELESPNQAAKAPKPLLPLPRSELPQMRPLAQGGESGAGSDRLRRTRPLLTEANGLA